MNEISFYFEHANLKKNVYRSYRNIFDQQHVKLETLLSKLQR